MILEVFSSLNGFAKRGGGCAAAAILCCPKARLWPCPRPCGFVRAGQEGSQPPGCSGVPPASPLPGRALCPAAGGLPVRSPLLTSGGCGLGGLQAEVIINQLLF